MKNVILASTSSLHGGTYLGYFNDELDELFKGIKTLIFIPYARPSGISHDEYTKIAQKFFHPKGIAVKGLHTFNDPIHAIENGEAFFTGGGNTFLLMKTLHENKAIFALKKEIEKGKPYLGTSAGSNIGGINMKTTNDMPIVFTPSFDGMALVPFNINPHYLDPDPNSTHNGETRETRILEFLTQNDIPVVGIREGNWVRLKDSKMWLDGKHSTRIFRKDKKPFEVESGTEITHLFD